MARMALVRTTVATEAQARELARSLVDARLAACVHVGAIESTYVWKGRREEGREWLVEARALASQAGAVRSRMLEGHPYEVPLVESLESDVNEEYVAWARGKGARGPA